MHRLMILKKFPLRKGNFSASSSQACFPRTCTLCNRILSTPQAGIGFPRIHSTMAHPEQSRNTVRKKKAKSSKSVAATRVDNPVYSKFRRKMKITVLESSTSGELPPSSFITSSPSSPVFAEPRLSGVTIMLPSNSSKNLEDTLSHLQKLTFTKTRPENSQEPPDLSHVAALVLSGLSRNRYLVDDFNSQQGQASSHETPSTILKEESRNAEDEIEKYANRNGVKETRRSPHELNSSRIKRINSRVSYIDIFVNAGNFKLAFKHAMLGIKYFPGYPGRNVLLDPLFCHVANEGDPACLVELLNLANRHSLSLTLLSYKNCLELMGRLPKTPFNIDVINVLLRSMEEAGIRLEDVISKCQNRPILIKKIFEAVDCVDPEKAACHAVTSLAYNVDVLLPMNDTSQGKAKRFYAPATGLMISENAEKLVDEQMAIHDSSLFKIKNIACDMSSSEIENLVQKQNALEEEWKVTIEDGIRNGLKALNKNLTSSRSLGKYLECLPISVYVSLVIQEVHSRLDDSDKQSVGFIQAQRALGKRAKVFYDHEVLKRYGIGNKAREAHIEYCKRYSNPELYPEGPSNPREIWESVVSDLNYDDTHASQVLIKWSLDIYSQIGKFLYDILLKDVKIDENMGTDRERHMVPALYVVYRKTTKGYQKQLKVHPAVHTVFPTRMQPYIAMDPYELPMVCPPRPWISATDGVYPLAAPRLQRIPDSLTGDLALQENLESVNTQDLYPSLDSLNQLGAVPWQVNNEVLDVVLEVFNSGGMKQLAIPSPPTASKQQPSIPLDATLLDKSSISKDRALIRQENAAEYSLWCDTLYKLCIANEFRDRVFWLPHNMDFRGRVYPICPHLQHMSGDMARSLLIFAKGEKLGPDGLDWLKIHSMNLVGNMSKDSITARLEYANKILPKILDSAENPLTGEKWWMDSEYPWQTLAACKEIANAVASGDPENFISHFPVHQDGSCNGLQHYAALGRDSLGAQSVNLVDTDKPSDVYSCVATLVEQQRAKDAAEGNELAQSLEGFIARKVVKPTVMTTVYGVTSYGAQMQIQGQLKDLDYPLEDGRKAAHYLMKLVFQSLGEMFTSSRNTQDWLTVCADKIVKGKGVPVKWVTPLGLPVIQPYFKNKRSQTSKRLQRQMLKENLSSAVCKYGEPSSQKQRNAFSPNFIHSLDSCHMILTGLHCEQAGITYVSVHDCFWVHACNVQAMSKICREQFVNLHSKPILQELSEFLQKTYLSDDRLLTNDKAIVAVENRRLKRLFRSVPPKGNFDLREVLKSKYFFS